MLIIFFLLLLFFIYLFFDWSSVKGKAQGNPFNLIM